MIDREQFDHLTRTLPVLQHAGPQQARRPPRLVLQTQRRDKASRQRGLIGWALVLLQAADLRLAVAYADGELALGEAGAAAQEFEQFTNSGEMIGRDGRGAGHGRSVQEIRAPQEAKMYQPWLDQLNKIHIG